MSGICYLIGAGPGDLGLVTLKARECVENADVLVYDHLCNPRILDWAMPKAERIYVGKKSGDHTLTQEEIDALLVKKTKSGAIVARLKGGDPFVFGRGGEEALALQAAGLRFEVVPGVSSAIAGPAYAGIPVTHRGVAAAFTVFTGHEDPEKPESGIDYSILAKLPGTRVMLMGVERLGTVTGKLLEAGADPELKVALVRWATTGQQQSLVGTLSTIALAAEEAQFAAPAVAIFGDVVGLRRELNWFENRPLSGKRIVVTRTRRQASELSSKLMELGADVLEIPTIRTVPPKDLLAFGELVQYSHSYDWIVFTSPNGVNAFFEMFYKLYDDAREIGGPRIAAVGPATAKRIREFHLKVDLQPDEAIGERLADALNAEGSVENLKILLVRPEVARDVVFTRLSKLGAIVDEAIAYRTEPETEDPTGDVKRFEELGADMVTFTSSSTAENFAAMKLPLPKNMVFASIGPITSTTMKKLGYSVDVQAKEHDVSGLVAAICKHFTGRAVGFSD